MKQKMTRKELMSHFHKGSSTVQSWTRGYYLRNGGSVYYYTDHRKLEPVSGTGEKFHPFLYSVKETLSYLHGMILDH